uniref:AhpA/YtjB family protein n=1 Tax=Ningiella ruwaisensis TaxID=2364274 RepID=UPI00109FF9EF|nr:AhpA/YtjB family protein [Ningiella ruwaisensis]
MSKLINQQNSSIFKRISSLILLICSVAIAINLYVMHAHNAQAWYETESEQLGRSLTIQAAKLLSQPMADENSEVISSYIKMINQGMFIEGAVVFDDLGVRLTGEDNRLSIVELISQDYEPLVFVEDILFEGETLGYIKLILNRDEIIRHHKAFNQTQFTQSILIIVLAMIIAMLATRLFYKFKRSYVMEQSTFK